MIKIYEQKKLKYSAEDIFNLVVDVEQYSKFLPWVQESCVYNKNTESFKADLTIGYKIFQETYTSKVEYGKVCNNTFEVKTVATKGPFKHLESLWNIVEEAPHECDINFYLCFELQSSLFHKTLESFLCSATKKMIEAFEMRAQKLYS